MLIPLIDVIHLKKHYPRRNGFFAKANDPVRAVDGVDLQIFAGETVALVGESGSGKTTLAQCLFRITKPSAGGVRFQGEEVWKMSKNDLQRFRRQAQFIFQDADAALNPRLSVGRVIAEPLIAHGMLEKKKAHQRADELLRQVGLSEHHFSALPGELSGGQRHRVVIARALALQPKFLAADEPFSCLDVLAKSRLLDLFVALQKQFNLTYFFISHDLDLVRQICHRVFVMRQGKIVDVQNGPP
jgi:ABC-type glutathione transport system ATPase component